MAGTIDVLAPSILMDTSTGKTSSKNDSSGKFNEILDGLMNLKNTEAPAVKKLTESSLAKSTLKDTVKKLFKGESGQELKDEIDSLDEETKEEVYKAIAVLLAAMSAELGGGQTADTQAYVNSLFEAGASGITDVKDYLLSMKDENISSKDLLNALSEMLRQAESNRENLCDAVSGQVSVMLDGAKYSMSVQDFLSQLNAVYTGVIESGGETEVTPPAEEIPPVTEEGAGGSTEEIPEPDTGTNTEEPVIPTTGASDETVNEQSLQKFMLGSRISVNEKELEEVKASLTAPSSAGAVSYQNVQNTTEGVAVHANSVQNQIAETLTSLLSASQVQNSEFKMILNPSTLGEIAVKIVNSGGQIAISIAAQNESTQNLLQSRLSSLVTNLQNTNGNVTDVRIVSANDSTGFANLNLSDFSRQNQNGSAYENKRGAYPEIKIISGTRSETSAASVNEYRGESKLWQTV